MRCHRGGISPGRCRARATASDAPWPTAPTAAQPGPAWRRGGRQGWRRRARRWRPRTRWRRSAGEPPLHPRPAGYGATDGASGVIRFCAYQYQNLPVATLRERWRQAEALGFDVLWNVDAVNEPDHAG